jgi:hypothetical protein
MSASRSRLEVEVEVEAHIEPPQTVATCCTKRARLADMAVSDLSKLALRHSMGFL